ncbi:hypothetical protein ACFLT8_06080 [Chloroflexota bacterium]
MPKRKRRRDDPVWNIVGAALASCFLLIVLKESISFGWYFVVMFIVTLIIYLRKFGYYRILENPYRIIIVWVVQILLLSIGSLLIEAKDSLFKGSILTAVVLLVTYLYLRSEFTKLRNR